MSLACCPTASQLEDFLLGRLANFAADTIEDHLDYCELCSGRVAELQLESRLMKVLTSHPDLLPVAATAGLKDISALRGMPLAQLSLGNTAIESLADIEVSELTELYINNTNVKDLTVVGRMPKLNKLHCNGCAIESFEPLVGATSACCTPISTRSVISRC